MSFVVANTEFVSGAAGNLARLGSMISAANSAAAGPDDRCRGRRRR